MRARPASAAGWPVGPLRYRIIGRPPSISCRIPSIPPIAPRQPDHMRIQGSTTAAVSRTIAARSTFAQVGQASSRRANVDSLIWISSYAGGSGVLVDGPLSPHFASTAVRIARSVIPLSLISITSRVIPMQMSQPKLIVSSRTRPSGSISRT